MNKNESSGRSSINPPYSRLRLRLDCVCGGGRLFLSSVELQKCVAPRERADYCYRRSGKEGKCSQEENESYLYHYKYKCIHVQYSDA